MKSLFQDLALIVLAAALVGGCGYIAGYAQAERHASVAARKAAEDAQRAYDTEVQRADQAVAKSIATLQEQEARYVDLDKQFAQLRARHGLAICPAAGRGVRPGGSSGGVVAGAAAPSAGLEPGTGGQGQGGTALPATGADVGPDGGPALTLAAVRMWNSALAGHDVAAGACGPDAAPGQADAADQACGQASAFTLSDAWSNHMDNARSCAADRQRYRDLIEYLQQRQGGHGQH